MLVAGSWSTLEATFPLANKPTTRARLTRNGCSCCLDFSFFSGDPKEGRSVHEQPLHVGIYIDPQCPPLCISQRYLERHRYVVTSPFYKKEGEPGWAGETLDDSEIK